MVSPRDVFIPLGDAAVEAFDDTRSWVAPNGYRLSDRVWRARAIDSGAVDSILIDAISGGRGAVEPVKALSKYLNPAYPGGNYGASRIARTETTRAFGQEAMRSARANPFVVGMKWNKSAGHSRMDPCDNNARNSSRGLEPGEYLHEEVPPYPQHPQCKCFLTPVLDPEADRILKGLVDNLRKDAELAALQAAPVPPPVRVSAPSSSLYQQALRGADALDTLVKQELLPAAADGATFRKASNDWYKTLTPEQGSAAIDYTGDMYIDINEHLRGITPNLDMMGIINDLDAALAKASTPADVVAYRGVRPGSPLHFNESPTVGQVIREPGYTSTSIDPKVSEGFTYGEGQVVEIVVPEGSQAVYAEPFTQAMGQDELLIHRNADFRVLGVSERGNVVLELVQAAVRLP